MRGKRQNMCTALFCKDDGGLFGRTLDLECSFGESVIITPRGYELPSPVGKTKYAIIGIGTARDGYPLYYDAMNECGLAVAGLNFPGYAAYQRGGGEGAVGSFEFIPYILGRCNSAVGAAQLLRRMWVSDKSFSGELPATPLHWMLAGADGCFVVEPVSDGLKIYENPYGVLTNSPPFPYQTARLADYAQLSSEYMPKMCEGILPPPYSRGLGAFGLPGDWSSSSRFVRAVYASSNTSHTGGRVGKIERFFRIMDTVCVPKGCIITEGGAPVMTVYTSVAELDGKCYYFTTEDSRRIRAVTLTEELARGTELLSFELSRGEDILRLNA